MQSAAKQFTNLDAPPPYTLTKNRQAPTTTPKVSLIQTTKTTRTTKACANATARNRAPVAMKKTMNASASATAKIQTNANASVTAVSRTVFAGAQDGVVAMGKTAIPTTRTVTAQNK
jgi:hypothetical protein